jgi:uncharacterized membrane protein YgcG
MPIRPRLLTPLLVFALLLLAVPAALAQTLTERVVDETGTLTDADVAEALDGIDALESSRGVQLWALFVPTTGGEPITEFATNVAAENGLGGNDAVLVVAIDDRRDALWVGPLLEDISNEEVDTILAERVEPQLADGQWGAAVAGAAEGLDEALGGTLEPEPEPEGQPAPSDDDGPNLLLLLIALVLIVGGGWLLWSRWQRGRAREADDRERDRRLRGLAQQANALLIETDEILRHNGQELGFAEAEFGAEAATPFREALAAARSELQEAFRIRQGLDDGVPEEPPERERMLNEIVERCAKARELVDAQTRHFQELRDLERRAPEILAEQPRQVDAVSLRLPDVEHALAELRSDAPGSSKAVHGNVAEARKRLEIASRSAADGRMALERGDRAAAARAAKASQEALGQATGLLAAIEREVAALNEARGAVDAAMAQARADMDVATAAVGSATETDQRGALAEAASKLEMAEAAIAGTPRDVVLAYRLAREAESTADDIVARVREGDERRAKERAAADAAIRSAELALDRADQFIAGRHHGVGRRPRTALSEADAALGRARALEDTDPKAAMAEARRATELADEAYRRAQLDFSATEQAGYGGTVVIDGRPYPRGRTTGWGEDIGGAIIGGIIGSILSGGGRGRGGFGGGFGGGGFGGGLGGGRSFGGGFGGGGGGRARGGGW